MGAYLTSRPDRACKHCGVAFSPRVANQAYCGSECQLRAKYALKTHSPKSCEQCSSVFQPKLKTSRYCSRQCGDRVRYPEIRATASHCDGCGKEITAARKGQRYCQRKCRQKSNTRSWKHSNPDKAAAHGKSRWNRIAQQADGSLTRNEVRQLFASASFCTYCGDRLGDCGGKPPSLDHAVPIAQGGSHSKSNAVVACLPCNVVKGNRTVEQWAYQIDRPVTGIDFRCEAVPHA